MLLMSFGIVLGYAKPTYQKETGSSNFPDKSIKELKVDIEKYSQAFDRMREVEDIKGGLQTKYNLISEKDRERLVKSLPLEVDVIRLIVDLTERSSAYGMSLKSISINKSSSSNSSSYSRPGEIQNLNSVPKYPFVDLSFEVTGSYDNLVSFFGDLEKSLRLVELVSVGISSASSASPSASTPQSTTPKTSVTNGYSAKITLRSYSLPDIIEVPISQNNEQPII